MTVAHFIGFPIDFNGNLQRASYEAMNIAKFGVNVNFLVSQEVISNSILEKTIPKKYGSCLNVFPLKPFMVNNSIGWRINNLLALPAGSFKVIDKSDVMHVHAPTPVTKPFSLTVLKKFTGKPLLLDLHDPWSGHPFSFSPKLMLQTAMMRYVINNADMVVVAHRALAILVKKFNKDKPVSLIPNGADTEIFCPRPRNLSLIRDLKIDPQDITILFSGHMGDEKGLDTLVYAARLVTKRYKGVKFLIAGDGSIKNKIVLLVKRMKLQSFFRFTGFVEAETLAEYISLADICVAPYKPLPHYSVMQIETPMKVVQYMAVGKPVIMSKVSEENVISWSGGGILTDPLSPEKLAEQIIDLIVDESSRKMMGRKGREYVEHNLKWSSIAEKLMRIYHSLL